jgi:hypothetical protein
MEKKKAEIRNHPKEKKYYNENSDKYVISRVEKELS